MRIAQGMLALQLKIRFPMIVAENTAERFEYAHGFDGITAALGVWKEESPFVGRNRMQP
jgi:hypothetical protein